MAELADLKVVAEEPGLLPQREAARVLGMSESWLSKDRVGDRPPVVPFVRLGRAVRYRKEDLLKLVGA